MRVLMRWVVIIPAVLLCAIAVSACGGGSDEEVARDNENGAPGTPGNDSDVQAPGAPINIPSIVQDQGRPLDEVLAEIESGIRDQCGGELCVELQVEMSDENFTECQFVRTRPPQGSEVERGTTVVVIAGTLPCDGEQPNDGGGSSEGSTEGDQ